MKKQPLTLLLSVLLAAALTLPAAAAPPPPALRASADRNYSTVAQNSYVYTSIRGSLERVAPATAQWQTLVKNDKAYNLKEFCLQGDSIYWLGGKSIYRCKTDGTGLTTLATIGGKPGSLRVVDGWLYYLSGSGLYRMKSDGTGRTQLDLGEVTQFETTGAFIFYVSSDCAQLFRCGMDGSGSGAVADLDGDWEPQVYGSILYYPQGQQWYSSTGAGRIIQGGKPWKIPNEYAAVRHVWEVGYDRKPISYRTKVYNRKTKKGFELPDTAEYSWFGTKTAFYFFQINEDKGLYSIGWDGKNKTKLANDGEAILTAGGYLVYKTGNSLGFAKEA